MIRFIRGRIRGKLHRLAWWYIRRSHDKSPGVARIDELILRMSRRKREPELYKQVNDLMDKIDKDVQEEGGWSNAINGTADLASVGLPKESEVAQ
jgi:hypothetical protein